MKVIRINKNNYFVNESGEKVLKYNPDTQLTLVCNIDGSDVRVDSKLFKISKSGFPSFIHFDEEYIIDDGYGIELARSGYIVKGDYDTLRTPKDEIEIANAERIEDFLTIKEIAEKYIGYYDEVICNNRKVKWSIVKYGFKYTFIIDPVSTIVGYNQQRKQLALPFYLFLKEMDKYRTYYLRVYCQKLEEDANEDKKYEVAEEYVSIISDMLNKYACSDYSYKFISMMFSKRKTYLLDFEG